MNSKQVNHLHTISKIQNLAILLEGKKSLIIIKFDYYEAFNFSDEENTNKNKSGYKNKIEINDFYVRAIFRFYLMDYFIIQIVSIYRVIEFDIIQNSIDEKKSNQIN